MSYNGSGTFNINTAGQPVVTGTTITSTAFNLLTADLATGLTTALTKDGQTTPTANIPMGAFKITGLGAGTAATDAAQYGQLQAGATTIATVTGTDTLTGSLTPAIAAYATGNLFSFVAAATNTGAATINLNSLGAKSITKQGSTALSAGDIVSNQLYLIEYDGTRFQLINPSSVSGVLSVSFGSTGLTPSTATNGAITVAGTLAATNGGTGLTSLGTGVATFLGTPSSANLLAAVSDETGTGSLVFATSPTLVTPILGTPTSGNLANCTFPTLNQNTSGSAATFTSTSQNSQFNSIGVGTAGSTTAGEIRATNNVTAYYSSDIKFKENVRDIPDALATVNAIGGKLFDWTDSYIESKGGADGYFVQKADFGVIAQDVQKVFPIAVRTRKDGSLAVDYEKLGSLAFAALVELTKRVEALEAK